MADNNVDDRSDSDDCDREAVVDASNNARKKVDVNLPNHIPQHLHNYRDELAESHPRTSAPREHANAQRMTPHRLQQNNPVTILTNSRSQRPQSEPRRKYQRQHHIPVSRSMLKGKGQVSSKGRPHFVGFRVGQDDISLGPNSPMGSKMKQRLGSQSFDQFTLDEYYDGQLCPINSYKNASSKFSRETGNAARRDHVSVLNNTSQHNVSVSPFETSTDHHGL